MAVNKLDITPTPQVLVALSHTPLKPLDAVSELIDNAIDSFRHGEELGKTQHIRHVRIEVPGQSEVERGEGVVRVRDSGPGLSQEQIAQAMRAGFSSKPQFGSLGLFGMGFNIATSKLGRVTTVISAQSEEPDAVRVVLDLPMLQENGEFAVTAERVQKPTGLEHGTVVEVRDWWPRDEPNGGFIRQLAKFPKKQLRDMVGRRYSTLLRRDGANALHIAVNGEACRGHEYCVWHESRFVEHPKFGKIPAKISVDKVLGRSYRCWKDGTEVGDSENCPACGASDVQPVVQRVHGWVGIQRYDDANEYGIDLVRNGRTIRAGEKGAFFSYTNPTTGVEEREYPMDSQYGRIVGEVHLDHVPVDFQKQDFQRNTPEWLEAMEHLRGGSLLPSSWEKSGEPPNDSPVSLLFQGYRRVRKIGRADMYPGQYDEAKGRAVRISRDREEELKQRFWNREPGYYDDLKWWELVETANEPPIEELPECEECGFQNTPEAERCQGCTRVLLGKKCLNDACRREIPRSAQSCPNCGEAQTPKVQIPWVCAFCGCSNKAGIETCTTCGAIQGAPHPASPEVLRTTAEKNADLSVRSLSVELVNGKTTDPLDVAVFVVVRPIAAAHRQPSVPLVTSKAPGRLEVYIDLTHPAFTSMGFRPEHLLAVEAARFLHTLHSDSRLAAHPGHTIAALTSQLLKAGWGERVADSADTVREEIKELFNTLRERVVDASNAADFYDELDEGQQKSLAESMINSGVDLTEMDRLRSSGAYLRYCDHESLVAFFNRHAPTWFGGRVWSEPWPSDALGPVVAAKVGEELHTKYLRCLEDCASYLRYEQPERLLVVRARAAVDFLNGKLA
ncbi:ATP-binding protein [Nocardia grenadensis]|uniref:ATP-binding protein n=1 Tax=Nocardia grenadensis TaxID=931537 RepID=UPI003D8FED54